MQSEATIENLTKDDGMLTTSMELMFPEKVIIPREGSKDIVVLAAILYQDKGSLSLRELKKLLGLSHEGINLRLQRYSYVQSWRETLINRQKRIKDYVKFREQSQKEEELLRLAEELFTRAYNEFGEYYVKAIGHYYTQQRPKRNGPRQSHSLRKVFEVIRVRREAELKGKPLSLSEIGERVNLRGSSVGRILNRVGLTPMFEYKVTKYKPREAV